MDGLASDNERNEDQEVLEQWVEAVLAQIQIVSAVMKSNSVWNRKLKLVHQGHLSRVSMGIMPQVWIYLFLFDCGNGWYDQRLCSFSLPYFLKIILKQI